MEEERCLRKVNRGERPKLTEDEIEKVGNCDRPVTKHEWPEMGIEMQWVTSEVMGLLKEEKQRESKTVRINVPEEESGRPKPPPPQAPWKFRTYPEDTTQEPWEVAEPASGSGNHLGDAERKGGGDSKGQDPKGKSDSEGEEPNGKRDTKGKAPRGKDPKGKNRTGQTAKANRFRQRRGYGRGDIWA